MAKDHPVNPRSFAMHREVPFFSSNKRTNVKW